MTKKRSKYLIALFAVILVLLLVATFVNFNYPFAIKGKYYSYSNFVSNIKMGEDVGDSYRIVYRAELQSGEASSNYEALKLSTIEGLKDLAKGEGYKDVYVASYGSDGIVVQIGDIIDESDIATIDALFGDLSSISFSMETGAENAFATAKDIKSVEAKEYYDSSSGETIYYVEVEFKDAEKIENATDGGGTIYIYFGDTYFSGLTIDSAITNGLIDIQSDDFVSILDAESYATKIKSGMLGLNLITIESGEISAGYGQNTNILLSILVGFLIVASFAYLIIKYKHFGWIMDAVLLFFITIGLGLIQSIPLATMNFAGWIAFAITYIFSVVSLVNIVEGIKQHYLGDTKLYIAVKVAFAEKLPLVFIENVLLILLGFTCMFMPSAGLMSMGWILLVLPMVTIFTTLVLFRLFAKMYLAFNSTNGQKLNFQKGGKDA